MRRQIAFDGIDRRDAVLEIESDTRDGKIGFTLKGCNGMMITPERARQAADFLVQVADELDPPKTEYKSWDADMIRAGTINPGAIVSGIVSSRLR